MIDNQHKCKDAELVEGICVFALTNPKDFFVYCCLDKPFMICPYIFNDSCIPDDAGNNPYLTETINNALEFIKWNTQTKTK